MLRFALLGFPSFVLFFIILFLTTFFYELRLVSDVCDLKVISNRLCASVYSFNKYFYLRIRRMQNLFDKLQVWEILFEDLAVYNKPLNHIRINERKVRIYLYVDPVLEFNSFTIFFTLLCRKFTVVTLTEFCYIAVQLRYTAFLLGYKPPWYFLVFDNACRAT